MEDAAYTSHLTNLGKIVYMYDTAKADVEALELIASRLYDQIATGEVDSWDTVQLLSPYTSAVANAVAAGPSALMQTAQTMAVAYLTSTIFTSTLDTAPSENTVAAILNAWITDMVADDKTLDEASDTGFVNFLTAIGGTPDPDPYPTDDTPTYTDAAYVTATLL